MGFEGGEGGQGGESGERDGWEEWYAFLSSSEREKMKIFTLPATRELREGWEGVEGTLPRDAREMGRRREGRRKGERGRRRSSLVVEEDLPRLLDIEDIRILLLSDLLGGFLVPVRVEVGSSGRSRRRERRT